MSVHSFVAHFLRENGYLNTLKAFEAEHGNIISPELPHEETLEGIIADRLKYLHIDDKESPQNIEVLSKELQTLKERQFKPWSAPYPESGSVLGPINELVVTCALFQINARKLALLATSAKSLLVVDLQSKAVVSKVSSVIGNVVVRRIVVSQKLMFLCGMNGRVTVGKLDEKMDFERLSEKQIHPRLVTDMKTVVWKGKTLLVSMGWDFLIKVHAVDETDDFKLMPVGKPFKLTTQGSCFDVVVHKNRLYVLVCKRELTLMDVLCMNDMNQMSDANGANNLYLDSRIALNDAEFSASGFTPMSLTIYKENEDSVPLVAVGTSHEPYMRIIVVSMLEVGNSDESHILRHQIVCNLNSYSPQDKYSDAEIYWRYDGSGVWVIGDDGVIRGLDILNKSVDVKLEGHEGRIKCSAVDGDVLLSCGTDRKVLGWV